MTKIVAAGGVLFRRSSSNVEVLLIKRNGNWDIPKGKMELDESIPACAVREVSEELGIDLPMIVRPLGQTEHNYLIEKEKIHKTTHWFLMYSDAKEFNLQSIEGITNVKWLSLEKAMSQVAYDNLQIVLERADAALRD
jgi:8-oxo-dGTP pyrophosphatase MutT (NUDIX family)